MMRLRELQCRLKLSVQAGIGWNGIGMAISVVLVATAFVILCLMVRDVGVGKVIAATMAKPPRAVLAACCLVCAGYLTLTLYDYFALRALGRYDVPYATAGLAGFAAYAIGHGLGLTLLTGNAVRLRIYSRWGLGVVEVAKLSFITGLSFWLGNICALGFALAVAPGTAAAVTHLPVWANQSFGLAAFTVIAVYVVWLLPRPRAVGTVSWRVVLPDARLTFWLIGIGILDLAAGSLATYVLLPATPSTDYVVIAIAYVIAALLGFVSHAPGSLGVFEAAMLVMLSQYQKEELLASLLILHVFYYLLPLAGALVVLGLRETRFVPKVRRPRAAFS
jgi:uncharacterized membrane protein YbhN (UPF0104 family)